MVFPKGLATCALCFMHGVTPNENSKGVCGWVCIWWVVTCACVCYHCIELLYTIAVRYVWDWVVKQVVRDTAYTVHYDYKLGKWECVNFTEPKTFYTWNLNHMHSWMIVLVCMQPTLTWKVCKTTLLLASGATTVVFYMITRVPVAFFCVWVVWVSQC